MTVSQENDPIKLGMMELNADLCVAMTAESGEEELSTNLKSRMRNGLVVSQKVHTEIESLVVNKDQVCLGC